MRQSNSGRRPYRIQVIDRALSVLDILGEDRVPVALGDLAVRLSLAKSSLVRILAVLERHRMVERTERGTYKLGLKLFELGSRALAQFNLEQRSAVRLERLVKAIGETAYLSVLDGNEMMVIARVESPRAVRVPATVGRRHPIHCSAVGKALLAFISEAEVRAIVRRARLYRRTKKTITSAKALLDEIRVTRQRGWSLDDEEVEEGLRCIAAPVVDRSGAAIAAIGILAPAFRLPKDRIDEIAEIVMKEANELSAEAGYAGAEPGRRGGVIRVNGPARSASVAGGGARGAA